MPIRTEKHISRAMLRAEPETLFVFGDKLHRKGLGGQAFGMRGELNAVGISTEREPLMRPAAFLADNRAAEDEYLQASRSDIAQRAAHLRVGGTVVLPEDGIGTGVADLQRRSPRVWAHPQTDLSTLWTVAFAARHVSAPSTAGRASA